MYFYSRINFINDFFSIVYCYIVYFLLVFARKSKFTIFLHLLRIRSLKVSLSIRYLKVIGYQVCIYTYVLLMKYFFNEDKYFHLKIN